ncbi:MULTISPECIES: MurR/RpiR family transcriptional regulator [unclassified Enterococcus]|uniref:MurR/RpiR family transcriptional regulator n=1 Tax=unclassified Enterococcus TaxID=2608891 RepID=UPI001CE1A910|nr:MULTISPECIES: MurR/RpiR family transcriptional regulator [unclassified Enterococcus]MCA5011527.1 MurR/RpiR family transcriptional regulator [Enterococcus sp. S23]MCA5015031.1 MurR/RpiR family transcriptional regulator [Enterococcus sp. S22(2020)]
MYLFQKIEEAVFKQFDARRIIGEFLLENRENLADYTMEDIAKLTHTSKSTLVRFAKHFDYSGWKEFMYAFTHEVVQFDNSSLEVDINIPFDQSANTLEIIENIAKLRIQTIKETSSLMSVSDINKAASILAESETIVIYGRSPNSYFGELFKRNLNTINKKAFLADADESGLISTTLTDKDCAIIISYSGNNPDSYPMKNVKLLLRNQVPIISITSGGDNYLRDYSTIVLNILSREKLYSKITNFSTEESIQFILDILYAKVFSLNYEENMLTKLSNSRSLEIERETTFKDISEDT